MYPTVNVWSALPLNGAAPIMLITTAVAAMALMDVSRTYSGG
jgi:hypothetical protein